MGNALRPEGLATLAERLPQDSPNPATEVLADRVTAEARELRKLLKACASRNIEVSEVPGETQDLSLAGGQSVVGGDPAVKDGGPAPQMPYHSEVVEEPEHVLRGSVVREEGERGHVTPDHDRRRRRDAGPEVLQEGLEDARVVLSEECDVSPGPVLYPKDFEVLQVIAATQPSSRSQDFFRSPNRTVPDHPHEEDALLRLKGVDPQDFDGLVVFEEDRGDDAMPNEELRGEVDGHAPKRHGYR